MGKYINIVDDVHIGVTFSEKCASLVTAGAAEVSGSNFEEDLVCVVDNGAFAAAGYAYDYAEYEYMKREDGRTKKWFILPRVEMYAE